MSRPLPRYTNTYITTVSHTRRPRPQPEHDTGNTNPTQTTIFIPNPEDLRGIPCIARGVGGTQPNTNPLTETIRRNP